MRKTRISLAMLAAFAIAGPVPLMAQGADSTNRSPSSDPPAGERLPASPGSAQSSGDTSSDSASNETSPSASGQSGTGTSSGATQPGTASQSGTGQSSTSQSSTVQSSQGSESPARGQSPDQTMSESGQMSGHGQMSGRMHGGKMRGQMSGQDMGANAQDDAARMEAWYRWHERMGQQRWQNDRGDYSAGQDWMDRGRSPGDYGRDRWSQDDYYDRGPGYQGRGRDRSAMGYDDQRRWRRDPRDQSYFPDYYSDRGDWRGPRYDRRLEEGSGYTYRDDPYYRDRDRGWDGPRYGRRAPGYYGDRGGDYSAEQDWGYRDRGDWRGGRWHGGRGSEGSADMYERYPQSRGQGMGDMMGRDSGYPEYDQGERGGPMTGERWERWQGSQWNGQPQWRSGMEGQSQYPNRAQRGQAGNTSGQTGSVSGGSSTEGASAAQQGSGTTDDSGSSSAGSSR